MQGSLKDLTQNATYQNLDHHEFDELSRYYFLVAYVAKDILENRPQSVKDTSLLWAFLMDYSVIPMGERKKLLQRSRVEGNWHQTVLNMAKNHFYDKKEAYIEHPSDKMYGSPIRFLAGSYSDDPTVMYMSVNTPLKTINANAFRNLECLTTLVITGQQLTSIATKAVSGCVNLKTVFVPSNVKVAPGAFPDTVKVYHYSDTIEAPLTPTQDVDELKTQIAELQKKCEEYETYTKYAEENEKLKARVAELEKQMSSTGEVDSLRQQLSAKEEEVTSLKEQFDKERAELTEKVESVQKASDDVQTLLASKIEEIASLKEQAGDGTKLLKELEATKNKAEGYITQISDLNAQLSSKDEEIKSLKEQASTNTDTEEKLSVAIQEKEKAWAMATELTRKVDTLEEDIKNLETIEAELSKAKAKIAELEESNTAVTADIQEKAKKAETHHEEEKATFARTITFVPDYAKPSEVLKAGKEMLTHLGLPDTDDFMACAYAVMLQKKFNDILIGYKDKNDGLTIQVDEVKHEVEATRDILKSKDEELNKAKQLIAELQVQPEKTEDNTELLNAIKTIEDLKAEAAAEQLKHEQLESQLREANESAEDLRKELEATKSAAADTTEVDELKAKVQELETDNSMKDAQLNALQSTLPDTEAEMEAVIGSVEFLGVKDKSTLEKATEEVIDNRSLMLPDGWENSPLAQASIVLMNEELRLLEERLTSDDKATVSLDNYPTLKEVLKVNDVSALLEMTGISPTDTTAVSAKLEEESKYARELLGDGQTEMKYGVMWPSSYRKLLDETQPREPAIANGITQLDFIRAIEVLKTLLEEKKLSSQSIRQIQDLVAETHKVNKYKDTILSVMSKYNETDYDSVYAYVLEHGDQSYRHIMRNDPDQFVAEEVDKVLSEKHTVKTTVIEPEHKGISSLTEADIYAEISKVYGNDGNEFLVDKFNELSGKVPENLPASTRLTMMKEMLKMPLTDAPSRKAPAINRNAYKSSADAIMGIYNSSASLSDIEKELTDTYGDKLDSNQHPENVLWILDAYLFRRQGFILDDSQPQQYNAYTCKRRLYQQMPSITFDELQSTFDTLVAKHAKITDNELALYEAVYKEITTLKEPVKA